jgi:hypothetical protein
MPRSASGSSAPRTPTRSGRVSGMVEEMLPPDCTVAFKGHGASPASVMTTDDPAFEKARVALSEEWPKPAAFIGSGGSIPIAGYFRTILGMESLLVGLRPGRRPDPFAEREIRPRKLPQGHAELGADPRRAHAVRARSEGLVPPRAPREYFRPEEAVSRSARRGGVGTDLFDEGPAASRRGPARSPAQDLPQASPGLGQRWRG